MTDTTITITRLPEADISTRVLALANAAKSAAWHGGYDGEPLPPDSHFIRGALALVHLLDASEAMLEAPMVVHLFASEFSDRESPVLSPRATLLAATLDDPSEVIAEAVMTNRRVHGLPPQLDIVPEATQEPTTHPLVDYSRALARLRARLGADDDLVQLASAATRLVSQLSEDAARWAGEGGRDSRVRDDLDAIAREPTGEL